MKRFLIATAVATMSALTLATPARADEASFFAYLDSHGYNYSTPGGDRDAALYTGRFYCQYPEWARSSSPTMGNPQYGLILEAAEHELCQNIPPAQDNAAGFFGYLDSHGYNYSTPNGGRDAALYTGRFYCQNPEWARSSSPTMGNPQYGLILEAAEHELCPGAPL